MDAAVQQLQTLLELEARHEELLDRLAELDTRVAEVLARCQASPPGDQIVPPGSDERTGGAAGSTPPGTFQAE